MLQLTHLYVRTLMYKVCMFYSNFVTFHHHSFVTYMYVCT